MKVRLVGTVRRSRRWRVSLGTGLLVVLILGVWLGVAAAGQWLLGSLCLHDADGARLYGDRLSVFLTTSPIEVPHTPGLASLERHQRIERINQMHLDFFKTFAQARSRPGYLVASTESATTGNFAFLDLAPGDYYLVVLFPAMIQGRKVAWQQAVTVHADRTAYAALDESGLVIPLAGE